MLDYYNKTSKSNESTLNKVSISDNADHNHAIIYFKKHSVPDKAITNALKSLIGVYVAVSVNRIVYYFSVFCISIPLIVLLQNIGVDSSFKFLQYVGLLKNDVSVGDFYKTNSKSRDEYSSYGHDRLKTVLGYEFKNSVLLLEALTHPSYFGDSTVECNYKLAFLGESILGMFDNSVKKRFFIMFRTN